MVEGGLSIDWRRDVPAASELFRFTHLRITGDGVRATLKRIQRQIPLTIHEIPSGTPVFDWTVPQEWNIRDAYIKNTRGERVIDFRQSNLHIVSYSTPIRKTVSLDELKPHLFTLPEHPDSLSYIVLPARLGILSESQTMAGAQRRRL
jgi:aminopeptidase-like protein